MPVIHRQLLLLPGSTRRAAEFLLATARQQWLFLPDHALPPFIDRRHDEHYLTPTAGPEKTLLAATLAATDLVLVSPPLY